MNAVKTVVITGGNTGIGLATAKQIAQRGARVILACRDQNKASAAREQILQAAPTAAVEIYALDLASFDSIRSFAEKVMQDHPAIDVLINNAGAYPVRQQYTREGFELQFGVNYLGHFLLTHLLLPALAAAGSARIVHLSSIMHNLGKLNFGSFKGRQHYSGTAAYAQSKLANAMFNADLARRLPTNITTNAVHPGGVESDIYREMPGWVYRILKLFLITPDRAAFLISDMALGDNWSGRNGEFKSAHGPLPIAKAVKDKELCDMLYDESCRLTKVKPL